MSSKKMPHMSSATGKRAFDASTTILFSPLASNVISGTSTDENTSAPSSFMVTLSPTHVISRSYHLPVSMVVPQFLRNGVEKS